MKRVGFVVHAGREAAIEAASSMVGELSGKAVSRQLENEPIGADETSAEGTFAHGLDLVVSVGGDGTFLRAARLAFPQRCGLVGVKAGRLGFLTEIEPSDGPGVIEAALDGSAGVEKRLPLVAETRGAPDTAIQWALNEVMVEKRTRHKLIKLRLAVDDEDFTTFSADGVIVASATGSTAYSFSARGPIVTPTLECLVVTPVAPHMVFDRSIVLAPSQKVTMDVLGDEPGILSADGRESMELPVGASVRIGAADHHSYLVRSPRGTHFFGLVREKFGLPSDQP